MTKRSILPVLAGVLWFVGCNSQEPVSLEQKWTAKLTTFQEQIDQVRAETEGVKDFSEIFGPGSREVSGNRDGLLLRGRLGLLVLTRAPQRRFGSGSGSITRTLSVPSVRVNSRVGTFFPDGFPRISSPHMITKRSGTVTL